MSSDPGIGIVREPGHGARQIAAEHLTQRHVLEYFTQRGAHGDPDVLEMRSLAAVVEGLGPHTANPGHRSTHHAQNIGNHDVVGLSGESKTSLGTPLARDQSPSSKIRQDCAQELARQLLLLRQMFRAHRMLARGQRQQRADCVVGLGGNLHTAILLWEKWKLLLDLRTSKVKFVFDLRQRSLYLCVPQRDDMATFLPSVLRGGVDIVQLREKDRPDDLRRLAALEMIRICRDFGVPLIMNDSPELAADVGADGVHVGQDDVAVAHCRSVLGDEAIVGLSTHATAEFDAALVQRTTYFSAGPIVPTPTKPGRPGTGVDYAVASQLRTTRPVFVTGGVNAASIAALAERGLRHFVVVRALTEASNPEAAARAMRTALDEALG